MARKNPPAQWVLPEIIDPESSRCIRIFVPNEKYHVAAFWGALQSLGSAYNWADDIAHTAREVALVWRDVIDSISEVCGVIDVRQNESDPCLLEKYDGTTWEPFAIIDLCAHNHPEYVAINPNTIDRNLVQPSVDGVYPLQLKQFAGSAIDIIRIFDNANGLSWKIDSNGKMKFIKPLAVDALLAGELSAIYAGFNTVSSGNGTLTYQPRLNFGHAWIGGTASAIRKMTLSAAGRLGIGENLTAANLLAYLHVFPTLASEIGAIIRAAASQTANLLEMHTSSNSFLSGIDSVGRFIFAVGSGKPADLIVRPGTTRIDTALKRIWVKGPNSGTDDWWAIGQELSTVDVNMLPAGDPPSGSISGDTITINIPETSIPVPDNYWFLGKQDRPAIGQTKIFELVVMADGYTIFPCEIADGDQISIDVLRGWWDDQNFDPTSTTSRPTGYNANGSLFTDPSTFTTLGSDPYTAEPHMCPILEYQLEDASYSGLQLDQGYVITIALLNDLNPYARLFANKELFGGAGGIQIKCILVATDTDELDIDSDGTEVTSEVTSDGIDYDVTLSGNFIIDDGESSDAWGTYSTMQSYPTLRGLGCTPLGVQINKQGGAGWEYLEPAAYDASHIYIFTIAGNGNAWKFRFVDCVYTDNSGSLDLLIEVA